MTGLLQKDFLVLRKTMWFVFPIALLWAIMPGLKDFVIIYLAILTLSTLSYDEQCKWNVIAKALPYSPFERVFSKYLFSYLWTAAGILLTVVCRFLVALVMKNPVSAEEFITTALAVLMSQLIIGVDLPLVFRFGVTKMRYLTLIFAGLLGGGFAAMTSSNEETFWIAELAGESAAFPAVMAISAAVVVLLHLGGIAFSIWAQEKYGN